MCDMYNMTHETRKFMAISLHRADQQMFELDFHDIERQILFNLGCVKKVIKLLKYMRDEKGGNMAKLWSHLLKVSFLEKNLIFKLKKNTRPAIVSLTYKSFKTLYGTFCPC